MQSQNILRTQSNYVFFWVFPQRLIDAVEAPKQQSTVRKYISGAIFAVIKVQLSLSTARRHTGGSRGTPPLILKLGKMWWVANFSPGRVAAGTVPGYPLDKSLDGPQGRSGPPGGQKASCSCRSSNSGRSEYETSTTWLATLTFHTKNSVHKVRKSACRTAPLYSPVFANTTLTPEVTETGRISYI